jgi:hypothetical protein
MAWMSMLPMYLKRANYAIVYVDKAKGDKVLTQALSNVKGFQSVAPSLFFDENVNLK